MSGLIATTPTKFYHWYCLVLLRTGCMRLSVMGNVGRSEQHNVSSQATNDGNGITLQIDSLELRSNEVKSLANYMLITI